MKHNSQYQIQSLPLRISRESPTTIPRVAAQPTEISVCVKRYVKGCLYKLYSTRMFIHSSRGQTHCGMFTQWNTARQVQRMNHSKHNFMDESPQTQC